MKETEIINCSPLLFFIGFYITDFICMSKFENILKQDWRGYCTTWRRNLSFIIIVIMTIIVIYNKPAHNIHDVIIIPEKSNKNKVFYSKHALQVDYSLQSVCTETMAGWPNLNKSQATQYTQPIQQIHVFASALTGLCIT